ncbi:MAG: glycerophosphodiester phosphodiesterase [Burkholderiales bacterium]|nr:glycerophosphodiester phosphodiesterase [Burkholderiales bacterium]
MIVIAHRGHSAAFPENTALAFEEAIAAGADAIETDVRLAREGTPVCWHDADLARVTGDPHEIARLDPATLKAIGLPRGQSLLTLEEVLRIARGRARVLLDVKIGTGAALEAIAGALAATGMQAAAIYGARTLEHLREAARRLRETALLAMPSHADDAERFLREDALAIRYWEDDVTQARVARAAALGREVWVTAGRRREGEPPGHATAERIARLAGMGVAAVLVNDPAAARAAAVGAAAPRAARRP